MRPAGGAVGVPSGVVEFSVVGYVLAVKDFDNGLGFLGWLNCPPWNKGFGVEAAGTGLEAGVVLC